MLFIETGYLGSTMKYRVLRWLIRSPYLNFQKINKNGPAQIIVGSKAQSSADWC